MTGLTKQIRDEILHAVSQVGRGATITDIEKRTRFERHTLAKYLFLMKMGGWLEYKLVGKAKMWYINAAPVQTILSMKPESMSFSQKLLQQLMQTLPIGLFIIDDNYAIQFMNAKVVDTYEDVTGQHFYQAVLGQKNPLRLAGIRDVVSGARENAELDILDKNGKLLHVKASRLQDATVMHLTMLLAEDVTEKRDMKKRQKTVVRKKR